MDKARWTHTDLSDVDARSARLAALAAALVESDEVILKADTEEEVYDGLCRVIVRHLGLPLVWVGLVEPGTRHVRVQAAAGEDAGYLEEAGFVKDGMLPAGSIVGRALRTGQAQVIEDLNSEPGMSPGWALAQKHGLRSSASFPLRTGHTTVGTLQCTSGQPGYFDEQVMALLGRLAAAASTMLVVIEHERRRRTVEQRLTDSEQRQHGLFDLAPVAIVVLRTGSKAGNVEANGAFLEMFGYSEQAEVEAAGLSIFDPADAGQAAELRSALDPSGIGPGIMQSRGRRSDGSTFPVLVERTQFELEGGPSIVLFFTDLTPLETAEAGSRQSRTHLEALLDNAPVAFLSLDLDGIIRSWNPAAERIFGRTAAEAMRRPMPGGLGQVKDLRSMVSGDLPQLRGQLVKHVRQDGKPIELRISTAGLADRNGESPRLLVVAEDVTDLNRAEAERTRLATAIDQSGESIVITDARATIQYVNPAFERVTGYTRAEAIGKNPSILHSGVQDAAFYAAMWAILARGETWRGTFVNRARDGRLFEEVAAISPVYDSAGKLINYVAVKRDVTREREAEHALRRSEERFRNLFDFANDGIFIREPAGRILEVNRTACERLGYTRDQLLTMTVADIEPRESATMLPERTEAILNQGSASFETAQVRRDGSVVPVEVSATVMDLAGRKVILSIARDISERKRADAERTALEDQLRERTAFAETIISSAGEGVIVLDGDLRYVV